MGEFTHFNEQGHAVMVDVSEKADTMREATAMGRIRMSKECFEKVKTGGMKREMSWELQGLQGSSELLPLCHILNLSKVTVEFEYIEETCEIEARCTTKTVGKTGVEMEALTGVQVALLTIYDMCKAVDKGMCMTGIRLLKKTGGKSGIWEADRETEL